MRYITNSTVMPLTQGMQKEEHRKIFIELRCQKKSTCQNQKINYKRTLIQIIGCFHQS